MSLHRTGLHANDWWRSSWDFLAQKVSTDWETRSFLKCKSVKWILTTVLYPLHRPAHGLCKMSRCHEFRQGEIRSLQDYRLCLSMLETVRYVNSDTALLRFPQDVQTFAWSVERGTGKRTWPFQTSKYQIRALPITASGIIQKKKKKLLSSTSGGWKFTQLVVSLNTLMLVSMTQTND